jgi:eukaryotic-like serine/threonine-protein kinase
MSLEAGRRLGLFEVIEPLGAGGMGEVYRARDTKLGRDVAIKVLPESFAASAERVARFEREARFLAALNHPGIAAIYGLEESDSIHFLVLELVEGRTLAHRIDRGALPPREALEIARQIAEALEAAHEKGIVHRDLKPLNIKLTPGGKVKLLDFGLAKALESATHTNSQVATETGSPTREGVILGTAPYMSPEQARGEAVDKRTDVWAFGCLVYEMLTGRRAFRGSTTSDTIVSVLTGEPDWTALPQGTGSAIRTLLRRCLTRDPSHRLHDIGDARIEIEEALAGPREGVLPAPAQEVAPRRRASLGLWLIAAAALVAAAMVAVRLLPPKAAPLASFTQLTFRRGWISSARFAPDGQTVVYTAAWDGAPSQLFSTRIGSRESRPLGIEGSLFSISRNGEMAVRLRHSFGARPEGTLARVSLSGGAPRELLRDVSLAEWDPDGRDLAVVRRANGRLRLEYPIGKTLYEPAGNVGSMRFLPTGSLVLLEGTPTEARPFVVSLVDPQGHRRVLSAGWQQYWELGGWCEKTREIWFAAARGGEDYALHAVDLSSRVRLVARVLGDFFVRDVDAQGRVLVNRGSARATTMALVPGETRERDVSSLEYSTVADLSADGRTLLLDELSGVSGRGAVYLKRTDGSPGVRLGDGEPNALSPDGRWALATPASGRLDHLLLLPTGVGEPRELRHPSIQTFIGATFCPDGKRLIVAAGPEPRRARLYAWDPDSGVPRPISTEEEWGGFVVSPDSRWVAAQGLASGLMLVPIEGGEARPVPGREEGDGPRRWSPDSRWLFVQRIAVQPPRVDRIDVRTGERHLWKEIMPADLTGVMRIGFVIPTPDGRGYAYDYFAALQSLYLAEGLR